MRFANYLPVSSKLIFQCFIFSCKAINLFPNLSNTGEKVMEQTSDVHLFAITHYYLYLIRQIE